MIGALTYAIARAGEADKDDASIIAFSFSSTCGIAKELNDEVKRNDWSYKDLIWEYYRWCWWSVCIECIRLMPYDFKTKNYKDHYNYLDYWHYKFSNIL